MFDFQLRYSHGQDQGTTRGWPPCPVTLFSFFMCTLFYHSVLTVLFVKLKLWAFTPLSGLKVQNFKKTEL